MIPSNKLKSDLAWKWWPAANGNPTVTNIVLGLHGKDLSTIELTLNTADL